jgi:hypothetical protein
MVIRSKVAGVTAKNPDGIKRQELIRRGCCAGMELLAVPESNNPYDPHAIGLWVEMIGKRWQIGYIKAGLADELCNYLDQGKSLSVHVLEVTGGDAGRSFGVNIRIDVARRKRSSVTVEATDKGWKAIRGFGCLGVLVGVVLIGLAMSTIAPPRQGLFTDRPHRGQVLVTRPHRLSVRSHPGLVVPRGIAGVPTLKTPSGLESPLPHRRASGRPIYRRGVPSRHTGE